MSLQLVRGAGGADLVEAVHLRARRLPSPEDPAFADCIDPFAGARVILLGECTHGTSEFYRARAAITQRLIERHGFRILAIEGDWPDAAELDRFIRGNKAWGAEPAFENFPRWMWRNSEFLAHLRRLRAWNAHRSVHDQVEVRGLDVYSLHRSINAVLTFLDKTDPRAADQARRRYACFTPFLNAPARYGASIAAGARSCERQVVDQLVSLLEARLETAASNGEGLFDATQNARVIHAAERYYRSIYNGYEESWNLRDTHMFETLIRLLARRGPQSKAVVWAHNSHIGDASASAMGDRGELSLGQLCRLGYGDQVCAIGFSTAGGTVTAAEQWGGPALTRTINPPRSDSWERIFAEGAPSVSITSWRDDAPLREALAGDRLERAIGVVYKPKTERWSHYFNARLSARFDAMIWFETTSALTPLAGAPPHGEPDIYPFGL
jgi:erythromycin esterase-like protein